MFGAVSTAGIAVVFGVAAVIGVPAQPTSSDATVDDTTVTDTTAAADTIPEGIALLSTPVARAIGVPFLPANRSVHFQARYDTREGSVDVFILQPYPLGESVDTSTGGQRVPCPSIPLFERRSRNSSVYEAAVDGYRLLFRLEHERVSTLLCPFAARFRADFEFFLDAGIYNGTREGASASAEDGGTIDGLRFDPSFRPEFPAVVDIER